VKTYFECLPCLVRQAIEGARHATTDAAIHEEVVRGFMRKLSEGDLSRSTPVFIGMVHRIVRELTGNSDPYRNAKDHFNRTALNLYPQFKEMIKSSADPVETALRLANAGNMIDMIVDASVEQADIGAALKEFITIRVPTATLEEFKALVERASAILYLGDNAGEIVFDRLLIEELPREKITFVVKGGPVINDVTMIDAQTTGMTDIVEVIDNGSDMPGTVLEACSETFCQRFRAADLIISKGQGNYESLSDLKKNMFFIFKAKCVVMELHLGCEIDTPVFLTIRDQQGRIAGQP